MITARKFLPAFIAGCVFFVGAGLAVSGHLAGPTVTVAAPPATAAPDPSDSCVRALGAIEAAMARLSQDTSKITGMLSLETQAGYTLDLGGRATAVLTDLTYITDVMLEKYYALKHECLAGSK